MPLCPACRRPVAVARDRCVYCGETLPAHLVPDPPALTAPPPTEVGQAAEGPAAERVLIVLVLRAAEPGAIERGLGLSAYEATQLARRGGFHLHRILPPERAQDEGRRLRSQGLAVELIPEAEVREPPLRALGGHRGQGRLDLRTETGALTLRRGDVLIVIRGPIARQYQPVYRPRRVETAALEEGYRVHLHRHSHHQAVELDAANFESGATLTGSTRLELDAWVEEIAADVPHDEGFRRLPPAYGVAEPEPRGPLAAAQALGRAGRRGTDNQSVLLDNVAQFRFYSAWRAALERRRRG